MQVVGLHPLPWNKARFEDDAANIAGRADEAELRAQLRTSWENAWIVVVEADADEEEIDFGAFAHPAPGPNAQAAWLECVLDESDGRQRGAFFLHFVDPAKPLWFGQKALVLPQPSPAPDELVDQMEYSSPD